MIHLVEGLNCSGKSTWINEQRRYMYDKSSQHLITHWLNPRRILDWNSAYADMALFMGYVSVINCINDFGKDEVYWDRTFLSAYAYGTIKMVNVHRIVEAMQEGDYVADIIFMDTPISVCKERWENENKAQEKPYAKVDDQEKILDRLQEVMLEVSSKFGIERMDIKYQGEKDED